MKIIAIVLLLSALLLSACATPIEVAQNEDVEETITVAATFYPYFSLTDAIVGDEGEVFSVVPPTTEPHGFTPNPQDIGRLQSINAFVATGVEFEAFEDQLIDSLRSGTPVIQTSKGIELLTAEAHGHEDEDEEEHEEEGDEHGTSGLDPHVWLSPKNAIIIANNINKELQAIAPNKAAALQLNAEALITELDALDTAFEEGLAMCEKDAIIVTHNAYQYLAKAYDFEVFAIGGLSHESEPTAKQIEELIEKATEHNISAVYFEELVQPVVAETIANEIGAETYTLNPVAGSVDGKTYIEIMYENLDKLKLGLQCS